jgi:hypothetical protein
MLDETESWIYFSSEKQISLNVDNALIKKTFCKIIHEAFNECGINVQNTDESKIVFIKSYRFN